ncbi:hypothetical protein NHG52_13275 [Bacillus thuringiensis]|uniref:hypothetical protein n=1 Tax=Bacillus thuringiensis TaxID=1428 RepID=UPI002157605B|nr:hypothetical protein [Bacillus thuringiensis]MCR6840893.1 hypothetical protein [Bacillus thuringiensis]
MKIKELGKWTKRNWKLNEDQKSVLLKVLKDMHFANAQLREWVSKDLLSIECQKPSIIDRKLF